MATIPAPDDDIEKILTGIMAKQSPLQKQARTQGLQAAQEAGLGQSTMGIKAAQAAAYNAALPIASQQAQQSLQKGMQQQQFGHETGMQQAGFQHSASQAELDRAQQKAMLVKQAELQRFENYEAMTRQQAHDTYMKTLDRSLQERLASMDMSAQNKERALSAMTQFNNSYAASISQVMSNEALPLEARQAYLNQMSSLLSHNQNLTTSLYRYDVPW